MTEEELGFRQYHEMPEGSIIRYPGKFESEARYVPEMWHVTLDGCADMDDDGQGNPTFTVEISPENIEQYPELEGFTSIRMMESDQGFVYHELLK